MGNGAAAAREVYGYKDTYAASAHASRMLLNVKVQKLVGEFLDAQKESLKKFTEQGNYFLTIVSQKLIEIIVDKNTSVENCFKAMEKLLRLGGFEISEQVTVAKIQAKADAGRGRAVLPGLSAPGIQPGQPSVGTVDNSRKTIFLLSPPPLPPGGVPTPALLEQWEELGWKPGVAQPSPVRDNVANAKPPPRPHGNLNRK